MFSKTYRKAFTLIEIMIVVLIIGLMASMVGPRLMKKKPSSEWTHVLQELNNLVYFARQEAISSQHNYRLVFFSGGVRESDTIKVEREEDNQEKPGEKHFISTQSEYFSGMYELPEEIKFHAIWQNKVEQLEENKRKAYCYVVPNGLVQDILIHMQRIVDKVESKSSFKMIPFYGTFELFSGHIKS